MKTLRATGALAALLLPLALAAHASAQEVKLAAPRQKITTASAVRARTAPQVAAEEVTRLKLGTILSAVARSGEEAEVGAKKDYWYRVQLPSGGSAWVFGGLLADYEPARRAEISRRIIDERLKAEQLSFEDGVDLYNFASAAAASASAPDARAEFELLRLLALGRSVASMPFDQRERPPYRDWYKAHEQEIVYSEPSASWLVRSELFWQLERKVHGTPAGERVAWEAAQNPLPGECEGDEVCHFLYLYDTEGRYLGLYPNGSHASEALKNLTEALASPDLESMLRSRGGDKYLAEQRAALRKALADLRLVVPKTSGPEKEPLLKILNRLPAAGGGARSR